MGFTLPVALIQTGVGGGVTAPVYLSQNSAIVGSGNSSMLITKPSGVASGDYLLWFFWHNVQLAITPPAGWTANTEIDQTFETSSHRAAFHSLIAGGSEPADYTWNFAGGAGGKQGVILAYRPAHATQPDVSGVSNPMDGGAAQASHQHADMTTLYPNSMAVYAWMLNRQSTLALGGISTGPSGMTQRYFADLSGVAAGDQGMAVYEELRPTAGAIGTKTLTTTNSDVRALGIRMAVRALGT